MTTSINGLRSSGDWRHGTIRVLMVTTSFEYGGLEQQVVWTANGLSARGLMVTLLVVGDRTDGPLRSLLSASVRVIHLRSFWKHRVLAEMRLAALVMTIRPHIAHLHVWGLNVGRVAHYLRVPVVLRHEHGMNLWKTPHDYAEEIRWRHCFDRRLAVSEDIRRLRIEKESFPPERIIVFPNGVAPQRSTPEQERELRRELGLGTDDLLLGTVGRCVEAKNFPVLLEAIRILKATHSFQFLLVGDGPDAERLRRLSRDLDIDDRVHFLGFRSDVPVCLGLLDGYVISSIREGLPVSLLEAMDCALPVVATNVGGIPEVVVDGKSGYLVQSPDAEALAEGMSKLLSLSREARSALGKEGRRIARSRYSIDALVDRTIDLYEGLLSHGGTRR